MYAGYEVQTEHTKCPRENLKRLIWCELKTTAFTRFVFIFSKLSYSNLNFGIKQSKIGWKFAEQWLPKVKISEPADDRQSDFFEKCTNLRQPYCIPKVYWSVKNSWICNTRLFYLVIKLTKLLASPKTRAKWKTNRGIGIIFFLLVIISSYSVRHLCLYGNLQT